MSFSLPKYNKPDFSQGDWQDAPNVTTAKVTKNGVAPEQFHCTTIFPEYYKINGQWILNEETRMNCCVVIRPNLQPETVEFRNLKRGDEVILGRTSNGADGIMINAVCFEERYIPGDHFAFRVGRSRETAFSQDYDTLYNLLMHEREHGNILWVMGPACSFDSDARASMKYLIENGFAHGVIAGNALAVHDLEAGLFGTALGQDIYSMRPQHNGHYNHLDIINSVRRCGSTKEFVERFDIDSGIMPALLRKEIPYVLAGSIRDDGPLPEVFSDSCEARDAMHGLVRKATTIICMATQLQTFAVGDLAPCYRIVDGEIRPLFIYSVDVSEYALNKLHDRGSLTATGIVTNVQDFIVMLAKGIQKKIGEFY